MKEQKKINSPLARWLQRRRAKRQEALEREYFHNERLDPSTRAFVKGEHDARFYGGNGGL